MRIFLFSDLGLHVIAEKILSKLDAQSLRSAEQVSHDWSRVVAEGQLWRKLIENNVRTDALWRGIGTRRGWYVVDAPVDGSVLKPSDWAVH
jgi:hypothetical protein